MRINGRVEKRGKRRKMKKRRKIKRKRKKKRRFVTWHRLAKICMGDLILRPSPVLKMKKDGREKKRENRRMKELKRERKKNTFTSCRTTHGGKGRFAIH